jgi:hypothetical protein
LFEREEDELFTFNLMAKGKLIVKHVEEQEMLAAGGRIDDLVDSGERKVVFRAMFG